MSGYFSEPIVWTPKRRSPWWAPWRWSRTRIATLSDHPQIVTIDLLGDPGTMPDTGERFSITGFEWEPGQGTRRMTDGVWGPWEP